ncbi:MAG: SDR family NAD(P)-dependent oxidoreductase [Polyangiales bacterium]
MSLRDSILDRSIFFSFDASGFERHAEKFTPLDASLKGQRFVVTGANSGLGLATSRSLAGRGAEVWMLCRNEERGKSARDLVRAKTRNDSVHLALVDMSSLAAVDAFVADFQGGPISAVRRSFVGFRKSSAGADHCRVAPDHRSGVRWRAAS